MSDEPRVEREDGDDGDDDVGAGDVVVPHDQLSAEALRGIIEDFVTREGTEYGVDDVELETKVAQVRRQLERGEVVVVFDAKTETVNLVRAADLPS